MFFSFSCSLYFTFSTFQQIICCPRPRRKSTKSNNCVESDDEAELLLMTTLECEGPTIIKKRAPWDGVRRGRRILVVSQQKFTWSLPKALYHSKDPVLFAVTFLYKLFLFSLSCRRGRTKRVIAGKQDKPCPFWQQNRTTNWYTNSSDEGLTLETSAFYPLTVYLEIYHLYHLILLIYRTIFAVCFLGWPMITVKPNAQLLPPSSCSMTSQ